MLTLVFINCENNTEEASSATTFTISSSEADGGFNPGGTIPDEFKYNQSGQCSGQNNFPKLVWTGVPASTASFVLIVEDPDGGDWVHLNLYNIAGSATGIDKLTASSYSITFPLGTAGQNSFGQSNWGGPCPPSGTGTHGYKFKVYALNVATISALADVTRSQFETDHSSKIIASAEITGNAAF